MRTSKAHGTAVLILPDEPSYDIGAAGATEIHVA